MVQQHFHQQDSHQNRNCSAFLSDDFDIESCVNHYLFSDFPTPDVLIAFCLVLLIAQLNLFHFITQYQVEYFMEPYQMNTM